MKKVKNYSYLVLSVLMVLALFLVSFHKKSDEATNFNEYLNLNPYEQKRDFVHLQTLQIDSTPGNAQFFEHSDVFYQVAFFKGQSEDDFIYPKEHLSIDQYRKQEAKYLNSVAKSQNLDLDKITFDYERELSWQFGDLYLSNIAKNIPATPVTRVDEYQLLKKITAEEILSRFYDYNEFDTTDYFLTSDQVNKLIRQIDSRHALLETKPEFYHVLVMLNEAPTIYSIQEASYQGLAGSGHFAYSVTSFHDKENMKRILPPGKLYVRYPHQ